MLSLQHSSLLSLPPVCLSPPPSTSGHPLLLTALKTEACGTLDWDDLQALETEAMQGSEDWDDLQALETEACGTLADMFSEDSVRHNETDGNGIRGPSIHVLKDSPKVQKHQNLMHLDSTSEDEGLNFIISSKKDIKSTYSSSNKSSQMHPHFDKSTSENKDGKIKTKQTSVLLFSGEKTCSMASNVGHGTLSYEELKSLDDLELANVVIFGNRAFRPLQHHACKAFVEKCDCFILMPKGGGGKSLCYQMAKTQKNKATAHHLPLPPKKKLHITWDC